MRAVYVIAEEGADVCKIGFTTDPKKRISSLQVGHSRQLRLAGAWQVEQAEALEKAVHVELSAHRLVGEWFSVSPFDAAFAVGAASARLGLVAARVDVSAFRLILTQPKRFPTLPTRQPTTPTAASAAGDDTVSPLSKWRAENGLSQRRFADLLEEDHSTLSRTERGLARPGKALLAKLVSHTGLSPAQVLEPWLQAAAAAEPEGAL